MPQPGDSFVANITLLSDLVSGQPPTEPPEPGEPPSIWPSPGRPAHPIFWPPSVWPPPGHVEHPIVIVPPDFLAPGVPAHPIVLPKPPGTDDPPMVSHPIVLPTPEHPIYFPTPPSYPPILGDPHPEHPIYYPVPSPPGSGGFHPFHPIVLPPKKGAVVVFENYAGTPPPPTGVPSDHIPAVLWFGPGTVAMVVWIPPIATPKMTGSKKG